MAIVTFPGELTELGLCLALMAMPEAPMRVSNSGNVVRGKRRAYVVFDTSGMGTRRDRKAAAAAWIAEHPDLT